MRIQNENRIGPGDDLGTVVRWEAGEQTVDLLTNQDLRITLEADDLAALRRAIEELDRSPR